MKIIFSILLIITSLLSNKAVSQDISGEWFGWGNLNSLPNENNYMISLNIMQSNEQIEGVMSIYYMNDYKSFPIVGIFDKKSKTFLISDIVVPMHFYDLPNFGKIGIDMYLNSKMINSRKSNQIKGQLVSKTYKTINNINFVLTRPYNTPNIKTEENTSITYSTSTNSTENRKIIITKDLNVFSDTIKIDLYDGSIIDDDTVSVMYNHQILADKIKLTQYPASFTIKLSKTSATHLLVLKAENLGSIPPNTGVMIVYDGDNRHEIFFSNSLQVSTGVLFTKSAR